VNPWRRFCFLLGKEVVAMALRIGFALCVTALVWLAARIVEALP
jgi:hypothetical protein